MSEEEVVAAAIFQGVGFYGAWESAGDTTRGQCFAAARSAIAALDKYREEEVERDLSSVIANLRHAYSHLVNDRFEPKQLANGLISPAIKRLEKIAAKGVPASPIQDDQEKGR